MINNNTKIALSPRQTQQPKVSKTEVIALEILQDNFFSDTDREEFSQAIKMHGVTFLRLSKSPISHPTLRDLGVMGRLARSLARFWPQSLVIGGCHD